MTICRELLEHIDDLVLQIDILAPNLNYLIPHLEELVPQMEAVLPYSETLVKDYASVLPLLHKVINGRTARWLPTLGRASMAVNRLTRRKSVKEDHRGDGAPSEEMATSIIGSNQGKSEISKSSSQLSS